MKMLKHVRRNCGGSGQRLAALPLILALLASTFALGAGAQQKKRAVTAPLSEDQRILHVLNRLGFGARPGDVERVRTMGIESYIHQQLSPEKIADPMAAAKVQNLATLNMTAAELYEKFPQPNQLLQQLQRRGELPADLAAARENRVKGNANPAPAPDGQKSGEDIEQPGAMPKQDASQNATQSTNATNNPVNPFDNEKYREVLREYYAKNGLQLPQRIVGELQASRILRAVYSERQLQEVMVDFWTNHFNVFAAKGADRWLITAYDRDAIRPHAMGKFCDLLEATAKSPAM